jgi:hypothetical protein
VNGQVNNIITANIIDGTDSFARKREKFYVKMNQLSDLAIACDIWRGTPVLAILDHTNDRIYNKL